VLLATQGFWPDGIYTAPADEALVFDILLAKSMGFNLLRKHVKVEPDRWYYHADRQAQLIDPSSLPPSLLESQEVISLFVMPGPLSLSEPLKSFGPVQAGNPCLAGHALHVLGGGNAPRRASGSATAV
jgi:hypothetical protein